MGESTIVVAGASGQLGERIVGALLERGAAVRARSPLPLRYPLTEAPHPEGNAPFARTRPVAEGYTCTMLTSPPLPRSREAARPRFAQLGLFTVLASVLVACGSSKGSAHTSSPDAGKDAAPHVTPDGGVDVHADSVADGPAVSTLCKVTAGTSGTLLRGTLLLPAGPSTGEVLVSSAGLITCAAASCSGASGYDAATVIDCAKGVISPALINTHDHTNYATVPPENHGDIRYDHRNDWRTGADGFTPLHSVPSTTDTATIAAQELRFVVGGATSVIGSGGVAGLARNLAAYNTATDETEGLKGPTVYFDTFPLGDDNGVVITSGCAYPSIEAASSAFGGGGRYAPHIAEGVNLGAENELHLRVGVDQRSGDLADLGHPRSGDERQRRGQAADGRLLPHLGATLEHQPLRRHGSGDGGSSTRECPSRSGPTGSRRAR